MFALTPIVILVLALTAGGTAAVAEHQADEAQASETTEAELAEGSAEGQPIEHLTARVKEPQPHADARRETVARVK